MGVQPVEAPVIRTEVNAVTVGNGSKPDRGVCEEAPPLFAGVGVQSGKVFVLMKGARSRLRPREIDAPGTRFLKLRLDEHDLALYYSSDGATWKQHPVGVEVSAYQHNIAGDFASLKPGAYTKGTGFLRLKDFKYRQLD